MIEANIPIIDLAPFGNPAADTKETARMIREACKHFGFFYVKNHGVPQTLIESIFQNSKQFFSLSREQKREIKMELSGSALRGYYEVGEEKTNGKVDYHEGIYVASEQDENHPRVISKTPLHGLNLYPKQVPALRTDVQAWLKQMSRLGEMLMGGFAESLGLKRTFFAQGLCKDHYNLMFLLHYPQLPTEANKQFQPLGEHCDYGCLTILNLTEKGLTLKNPNNEWISVDPIPGTFVINVGDMLQKMTKGLYKSTPHKVVSTGKERFSIPYFYDPGWDQTIPELDIFISEEEKEVLEKTRKYKRIDEGNIEEHTLTIGEYYLAKHSKTFPELYEKFLKQA